MEKQYELEDCSVSLIDYKHRTSSNARFTMQEIKDLEQVLHKYDKIKINEFVKSIELICSVKHDRKNDSDKPKTIKNRRKKLINDLENTKNTLHKISMPVDGFDKYECNIIDNIIPNYVLRPQLDIKWPEWHYDYIPIKNEARCLAHNLEDLICKLRKYDDKLNNLKSKGRNNADYDNFYTQIAEAFLVYIGKPNKKIEGEFTNVMRIINEAVGLQSGDLSKGVNQALDKIGYPNFLLDEE